MTPFTWLVIFVLIAIGALYVAAEFAAVSVRRTQIRQLAEDGNALALRLLPILEDAKKLDRYIAACQIGITLSSLVMGAFGQATLAKSLVPLFERWGGMQQIGAESAAAVATLIGLTLLHMMLSELVPKSLALQYPTQIALYTLMPLRWSLTLFSWFIFLLNGSGLLLLKLLGVPRGGPRHIHSPEEIDLLLAESRDGGVLEPDEHRRLRQALRLEVRLVHQLMVPRAQIVAIDIKTPIDQILQQLAKVPYTRVPVYRDTLDNIVGLLLTKDLVLHHIENHGVSSVEKLLRPAVFILKNVSADRLITLLRERRSHQAIVVDELSRVAGLVTLEDVLGSMIGEVGDEFKEGEPEPEHLADGRLRLSGIIPFEEAESWLGTNWEGKANTVSGRIIEALGHLPKAGEHIVINGVDIEIERIEDPVIGSILVKLPPPAEEESHG
jgi:CBS domain containing-hemolysin-like protein